MCNYEGRTTSFLPRRLEREPTVKCCLQGYLQVIPKRLLKLLLRSRWLSIKKVQVFNPEEYGPINLSIFHENVQCCLTNVYLQSIYRSPLFPNLAICSVQMLMWRETKMLYCLSYSYISSRKSFYTYRKKIPKSKKRKKNLTTLFRGKGEGTHYSSVSQLQPRNSRVSWHNINTYKPWITLEPTSIFY